MSHAQSGEVALVFRNETSGLSGEDVALCQMPVMIPTNPKYSSLNLGAAVQILCYELRMHCESELSDRAARGGACEFRGGGALSRAPRERHGQQRLFRPANPKQGCCSVCDGFWADPAREEEVRNPQGFLAAVDRKPD